MKKLMMTGAVILCGLAGPAAAEDMEALINEAKGLIQEFGGALKSELMAGVEAGGPVNAISVCNERAPEIATAVSTDGWTVGRSSHKLRNPENAADAFTAEAIAGFLTLQAAGESAETMAKAGITEENGQRVFHFVKAIPTGELCLGCHGGDNVKPEVAAKLAELYPDDQARGFTAGEMRGVFTLTKVLE